MSVSPERIKLLQKVGYKYDFTRDIYINVEDKVIISKQALEDNSDVWLDKELAASNKDNWSFLFTEKPSDLAKDKLLQELRLK